MGGATTAILGLDFTDTLARAISLTATNTAIETLAGRVATVSGAVSGTFPLRKIGSGVLVFSGSNAYNGTMTVEDGQLRLTGSFGLTGGIGFNAVAGGSSALVIGTGSSSGVLGLGANNPTTTGRDRLFADRVIGVGANRLSRNALRSLDALPARRPCNPRFRAFSPQFRAVFAGFSGASADP